ncbi:MULTISPECIES: ATP-dependent nuclease [unclassified Aureimonas]|uniref:ATP-dependent nuclease n=1 Tax=unclassified Aureimonas TaxID=2615206 RepID=UPI0009E7CA36|nr:MULTISPECIES: ATP-dependent endonuclease [unclassified Aureimonas]
MRIEKVRVQGFRLLEDVEIMLEGVSTIIVGRNNSGKTSLTDVFERFVCERAASFRLQDFSASSRGRFYEAKELWSSNSQLSDVLGVLPKIVLTLSLIYDKTALDVGPLSPFIIDLDTNSSTVVVRMEYAPVASSLGILLDTPTPDSGVDPRLSFYKHLKETISRAYKISVIAVDPTDESNQRRFDEITGLFALLQCSLVRAQRTLDHVRHGDTNAIGQLLGTLFKTATAPTAAQADQNLAAKLKASVESIERSVQEEFDDMLAGLLPAMDALGFPGLNDTLLHPETSLNVEALLHDHTRVVYTGTDGVHLPEGYNGLGTRNLIYMLLQLESYHKEYRARATRPSTHLVFIEEPEAHLHPQMQEVLVNQLSEAVKRLSANYPKEPVWQVQFVISTHSSHVANSAPFESVRYFLNDQSTTGGARRTIVKDFRKGLSAIPDDDQDFLHQYMTLTNCDLYFADKAIMVEGTTERILMPRICDMVDQGIEEKNRLSRQYVTTVEAGGAHAHIFYPLLDFLELKTLFITDIDSVHEVKKVNKKGKKITVWEKCPVSDGTRTSNTAIRDWFKPKVTTKPGDKAPPLPDFSPQELLSKNDADKQDGFRRLAYQLPEIVGSTVCARSYEDALVLANPDRFDWPKEEDEATEAWHIAKDLPKAETALDFAIRQKDWTVPRYIREGLEWLSQPPPPPEANPLDAFEDPEIKALIG